MVMKHIFFSVFRQNVWSAQWCGAWCTSWTGRQCQGGMR